MRDFGVLFADSFYAGFAAGAATVTAGEPRPIAVGGATGATSVLTVTPRARGGRCPEPAGVLTVVAFPTERRGASGGSGVLLLVLARDTGGGPAQPPTVDERTAAEVLGSLRVARPAPPAR